MAIKHTIGNALCECIHCTRRRQLEAARKNRPNAQTKFTIVKKLVDNTPASHFPAHGQTPSPSQPTQHPIPKNPKPKRPSQNPPNK